MSESERAFREWHRTMFYEVRDADLLYGSAVTARWVTWQAAMEHATGDLEEIRHALAMVLRGKPTVDDMSRIEKLSWPLRGRDE